MTIFSTLLFLLGDFSEASVYLDFNQLTRFDSAVYENLLEQMHSSTTDAGLYVHNSK
jgi:anti-anti-sigma regulatory factor